MANLEIPLTMYIPVGPSEMEIARLSDLLSSLLHYEPGITNFVIVDHGPAARDLTTCWSGHSGCSFVVIRIANQTHNGTWLGAACNANLAVLDYVLREHPNHSVLKMDTDALVIGPFAQQICDLFDSDKRIGMAGSLGNSCNRSVRTMRFDDASQSLFSDLLRVYERLVRSMPLDNREIVAWNLFCKEQRDSFLRVGAELGSLKDTGFRGTHCQGGAYAASNSFLRRMHLDGLLIFPDRWTWLPVGEDKMMGMYAHLIGLEQRDFSNWGEPFGVQAQGLPFPPQEILERQYGLIHSVRTDPHRTEEQLRRFFRNTRRAKSITDAPPFA